MLSFSGNRFSPRTSSSAHSLRAPCSVCLNTSFLSPGFFDLPKDQIDFQTHKNRYKDEREWRESLLSLICLFTFHLFSFYSFPDDLMIRIAFSESPIAPPSSPLVYSPPAPSPKSPSSVVVVEDVEFEKISSSN